MALLKQSAGLLPAENFRRSGLAFDAIDSNSGSISILATQREQLDAKVNDLNQQRAIDIQTLFNLVNPQPGINAGLQRQIGDLVNLASPQPGINTELQRQIAVLLNRIIGHDLALADLDASRDEAALTPDGLSSVSRPGDGRLAFALLSSVASFGGPPAALAPVPASALSQTDQGAAVDIRAAGILGARLHRVVEPGRVYHVRTVLRRRANPSDPNNDLVRVALVWLDAAGNVLRGRPFTIVKDLPTFTTSSGRVQVETYVARSAGPGVLIEAPPGARAFRTIVWSFGLDGVTSVEAIESRDVTGLPQFPAAGGPDLAARVTTIESQDLAAKIAAIQSQLQTPTSLTFATVTDAAGATISSSVTTLDVRGAATAGDGGGRLHVRVSGLAGRPGFRSADGAYWLRLVGRLVLDDVSDAKAKGAIGDGVSLDSTALLALAQDLSDRTRNPFGRRGFLPVGLYRSDKKITITLTGSQIAQLACDGRHSARIIFTNPQDCGLEILIAKQSGVAQALCQAVVVQNITILCDWLNTSIAAGGRLAGTALKVGWAPGGSGSVIASPLPSVTISNVTISNLHVPSIETNYGGWAVHYQCDSLNITNTTDLNFDQMVYGSIGMVHDTDGSPSFIHTHQNLVMNGDAALCVKIGKDENDVPLQGFIFDNPTLVSGHPQAVGYDVRAKYAATNAIGDHLDVRGGHHNLWKVARLQGWRAALIETYALVKPGGIGVEAVGYCGPLRMRGIWNLQGDGAARAAVLTDVSTLEDGGFDIDIQAVRAIVPPVLLKGTTGGGMVRGTVNTAVSFVPIVDDQSTKGSTHYDYACNGIRRIRPAPASDLSDAIATTMWAATNLRGIAGRIGVAANATLGDAHVNRLVLLFAPVTVTLPDASAYPRRSVILQNTTNAACNILGSGIATNEASLAVGEIIEVMSLDGQWSILSRFFRVGSSPR